MTYSKTQSTITDIRRGLFLAQAMPESDPRAIEVISHYTGLYWELYVSTETGEAVKPDNFDNTGKELAAFVNSLGTEARECWEWHRKQAQEELEGGQIHNLSCLLWEGY